jgi:molecular chaperone HtpG
VVDSPDLSLNISREMLQHDRQLTVIKNNIEKKVKNELSRLLSDEREKYLEFYKSFGTQIKYGVVDGYGMKADLVKDLVMFHSMAQDRLVTLKEYVDAMPEGQERIYYASAESVARAKQLPQTEQVRDKGYDILCLTEDVDEFAIRTLRTYEEKEFCDISGKDLGLETEEEKKEADAKEEDEKDVLDFVKETLGDKVSSVKLSRKLKTHAVCLSTEGDVSLEMEKYFASIPGAPEMERVKAQRVLEINGSHPAFDALKKAFSEDKEKAKDMARIMYVQALLIAGMPVDDIMGYSDLVFKLF